MTAARWLTGVLAAVVVIGGFAWSMRIVMNTWREVGDLALSVIALVTISIGVAFLIAFTFTGQWSG